MVRGDGGSVVFSSDVRPNPSMSPPDPGMSSASASLSLPTIPRVAVLSSLCRVTPKAEPEVSSSTSIIESFAGFESPAVVWTADCVVTMTALSCDRCQLALIGVPGKSNAHWLSGAQSVLCVRSLKIHCTASPGGSVSACVIAVSVSPRLMCDAYRPGLSESRRVELASAWSV